MSEAVCPRHASIYRVGSMSNEVRTLVETRNDITYNGKIFVQTLMSSSICVICFQRGYSNFSGSPPQLLLVFWNSITTRITITEYCERWSCCSSKFGGLARSSPLLKVEEAAAAALVVIDEAVGGAAFKPRMLFSSRLLETASLLKIRRHLYLLQT